MISLGAGKDSLFFRLKSSGLALSSGWGYFEVDFEAVVSWKARIIERLPALSSLTLAVAGSDTASEPCGFVSNAGPLVDMSVRRVKRVSGSDCHGTTMC